MNNWYVITGGPSSGITVTTDRLAIMGHHTIPEAARIVIDKGISEGKSIKEIRKDEFGFQRTVLKMKQGLEEKLPKDRLIFFERGIPDTLAYYRLLGADTIDILDVCKSSSYKKVFVLEPLPYKQDYARIEGEEKARKIFELLKEAYQELGMEVVVIPKATIEERVKMIISEID